MKYEKFTDQMEYSGEPSVKLYKHGQIRFNREAGMRWFQDCEYVELYIPNEGTEIAVKPVPNEREGTYAYGRDGEYGGHVSVRSVLSHFGIWHEKMDESLPLPVRWDEDREMVIVDISEPVERWGHTANQD